jgi:hypothetical protein
MRVPGRCRHLCVAVLLLATAASAAGARVPEAVGAKAAERPADEAWVVPASTQLGMWIMTLLLLSASSVAMLGGGLWHRVTASVAQRSGAASRSETEKRSEAGQERAVPSPKNRSKRALAGWQATQERRSRPGRGLARRRVESMRPRRRGGAGCRGVR